MVLEVVKKYRWELLSVIAFLIGVFLIYSFVISPEEDPLTRGIISTGKIRHPDPYLDIRVSPSGYPPFGETWTINVYIVDTTPALPKFQPALNSTVIVTVSSKGSEQTCDLPVDENGRASFQFLPEYRDIAFHATRPGLPPSEKIVLSEHFVSSEVVDSLLAYNIFVPAIGSPIMALKIRRERIGKLAILTISFIIFSFCFVGLVSLYSKLFQYTIWGYPNNIAGGFITFDSLIYISYLATVLGFLFWIIYWLHLRVRTQ